ncbi:MAG: hypothetical protein ACRDZO_07775 [Egibacteraceae bacterium]
MARWSPPMAGSGVVAAPEPVPAGADSGAGNSGPGRAGLTRALSGVFVLLLLAVVIGPSLGIASDPSGFYSHAPVSAVVFTLLGRTLAVRQPRKPGGLAIHGHRGDLGARGRR